jgi:hypothetical protein
MRGVLPAVITLTLAGCAGLDAAQCRGADWRDLGYREGLTGNQPRIETYSAQCAPHGVQPSVSRYDEGFQVGRMEFEARNSNSGTD